MYNEPANGDPIGRVNRLLLAWPTDDNLPGDGYESVRSTYKKLAAGLNEIKSTAERDVEAIDKAIEQLDVLIALRKAPEPAPQQGEKINYMDVAGADSLIEKRNKRPRPHSPASSAPAMQGPTPTVRSVTLNLPARNSVGPSTSVPFSREPKARREALAKQLPLQEGRKVAFHPPQNSKGSDGAAGGKDEEWILAVVIGCINQDKNRYEVQDPEPQEDGQPGQRYNTTLRAIIPLPDPSAPPDSAAHLNAYPAFSAGSTVMALYPDTSCFYRAEVVASPRDMQPAPRGGTSATPTYKLKFEDDDDQEHLVSAQWVVEWPGGS
ncbi:hypothetical protein FOMPIDRAFT_1112120 [Fomitopsis schrenkii]|uniref:SGF29 C-terminal domain-containing protein n=1 Tax=Fomitopsis schrenkii TaxID=2126942 RepID=S8EJB1_FOMSC|nr:hypothetical protein FOMPIDRAFT_1112120 [Fomitopsis schrenkii]